MVNLTQFTVAEAAFVLRQPVRAVTKALEQGPVLPTRRVRAGASVRMIDWADLFYLFVARALRDDLTPKARRELYEALRRAGPEYGDEVRVGRFRIAVADLVDEVNRRTAELAELAELKGKTAVGDDDGASLDFRGVEVHRIAALLKGGLSVDAVREEYPWLSRAAVEAARSYALVRPKPGRPYPRTTASRLKREA
jgi:hypothetical protein